MVTVGLGDGFAMATFYGDPVNHGEKYRTFGFTEDKMTGPDDIVLTMKEARDLLKFLKAHVDQED